MDKCVLNEDQVKLLTGIARMADTAVTEGERANGRSLLLKKLSTYGFKMETLVSALEHFQGREEIDAAMAELTQAVESMSEQLVHKERELAKKTEANAALEDTIRAFKLNGGHTNTGAFKNAASSSQQGTSHIGDAALLARAEAAEKSLRDCVGQLKLTEDALQKVGQDLQKEMAAKADILQALDNKAAADAALIRQTMEQLLPKIMMPVAPVAPSGHTPSVIAELQKYFANALIPMNRMTKFRDEVTLFMQIMAKGQNSQLIHTKLETDTFMRRPVNDPMAHACMDIYEFGNKTFGLMINNTDNWLYTDYSKKTLQYYFTHTYSYYWSERERARKNNRKDPFGNLFYPEISSNDQTPIPIHNSERLDISPLVKAVLPLVFKSSADVSNLRHILRPMGYVI